MIKRQEQTPIMHRVVRHGDTLYLGGVTASDKSLDFKGQAAQALLRLEDILERSGSDRGKVLSAIVFLTDLGYKDELNEAWLSFFSSATLPARATVSVAGLGKGTLIEIVATAAA